MPDTMPKHTFLAFTGSDIDQSEEIVEMGAEYECWNFRWFTMDSFISTLQAKVPPLNRSVLNNYRADDDDPRPNFGIRPSDFEEYSWGLLLPEAVPEVLGYGETLFLLNLYSPTFLYPAFHATDFGIFPIRQPRDPRPFFANQNQARRFSTAAFVEFHRTLVSESVYSVWQAYRVSRWNQEDWRLFVASRLFSELQQYEGSKQVFGWQRESTDLATILEALFTAEGSESTEIGYRLRKRLAVLLSKHAGNIEKDVKELYKQRSSFVHGSFFQRIYKEMKITNGVAELPLPPSPSFTDKKRTYAEL